MHHVLNEAGVIVYAVLVAGILSVAYAWQYARSRDPDKLLRWCSLAALAFAFGLLGSVAGVQASVQYISTIPDRWLFLIGLRESLHNTSIALTFIIIDLLVLLCVPRQADTARLTTTQPQSTI